MKSSTYSYTLAGLAALLWASTAAVVKLLLVDFNSLQILFYATGLATASLFTVALFFKKLALVRKYAISDYQRFAAMGFLGIFLYTLFLFLALDYLPAQEAFIINYLWPIAVVLFAIPLLKEKVTGRKMLALGISFLGVVAVVSHGKIMDLQFSNITGVIMGLAAALSYGLFSVLGKKHDDDRVLSIAFYYLFGFIFAAVAIFLFGDFPRVSQGSALGLIWLGVFANGLPFLFWFLALKHGDTAKMSNIIYLTPFLSLVFIYFLLGETILISSVVGLLLILSGVIIQTKSQKFIK